MVNIKIKTKKDKIINRYTHSILYRSQTEVFNRPSFKLGLFENEIYQNRYHSCKRKWNVWFAVNDTQVYSNEYIGRWIKRYGIFDEL